MKPVAGSALVLLSLLSSIQAFPRSNLKQTPIPLPSNNPISNKFSSCLPAVNTADKDTISDSYSTSRTQRPSEDGEDCKAKNWTYAAPAQITRLANLLELIPKDDPIWNDYEKALQPLTPFRRNRLIGDIVDVLRQQYAYPDQAEKKVARIFNSLKNGEYDSITDNEEFRMRVEQDLGNTIFCLDNKISPSFSGPYIAFHEPFWLLKGSQWSENKQIQKMNFEREKYIKEDGYGFRNITLDTETIPSKTIATLRITQLYELDLPGMLFAITEKMNSIADADILILDLRSCFGMGEDIVAYILSYLFDEPKPLTKTIDRNGVVHSTTSTITIAELPRGAKLYGGQKPIYVLTNRGSGLQAKLLAYSLQAYQRAVIVGEEVLMAGWAGWAGRRETSVELCEDVFGKGWWTMWVQTLRTVHLATGSDWPEGGLKSDVVVEENGDARLAAIEFEKGRIEREEGLEKQDELK